MSEQEATMESAPDPTVEGDPDTMVGGDTRSLESRTKTCVNCGAVIDEYEWFPIRGREDEDGEFRLYSFCDEECVESWEE